MTINYLNPSSEVLIYLTFIVALCKSDFSDFLYHHIRNQTIDSHYFSSFYAAKFDEYMFSRFVDQTKNVFIIITNGSRVHHVFSHYRAGGGGLIAGEKKNLTTVDLPLEVEAKLLEKGTLTPEEKFFLGKKRSIEKKMMSGA